MNTWAILPIKPFNRSKSRLSGVLNNAQREALSREMMEHTLSTLKQVQGLGGILVVSRDTAALSLARRFEAQTIQESGTPELNLALTRATQVVSAWNAWSVIVLASDIPLLRPEDIEEMLALGEVPNTVVIASDRRGEGTNAILMHPPALIPYCFGKGSFQKHLSEAHLAGVQVHIYQSPTLALDVDIPADLDLYREMLIERELKEPLWLGSM